MSIHIKDEYKQILQSPIPPLHTVPNFRTAKCGGSSFKLRPNQVLPWPSFKQDVIDFVRYDGKILDAQYLSVGIEHYGVGSEIGIHSRVIEHVGHPLSGLYPALGIGMKMSDFQYGATASGTSGSKIVRKSQKEGKYGKYPDMVIVGKSDQIIRVAGEVKPPWNFKPGKKMSWEVFLAQKLGQPGRYIDDLGCEYGFLTTYNHTRFMKRGGPREFLVSEPISFDQLATKDEPTVRECFLYLGYVAGRAGPNTMGRVGSDLTAGVRKLPVRYRANHQLRSGQVEPYLSLP